MKTPKRQKTFPRSRHGSAQTCVGTIGGVVGPSYVTLDRTRGKTVEKYVESSRQCRDVNEGKEPAWWENARQTVPGENSSDSTPKVC